MSIIGTGRPAAAEKTSPEAVQCPSAWRRPLDVISAGLMDGPEAV